MSYFVKNKKVHKNPPQNGCTAKKGDSPSLPTIPHGVEKCDRCFRLPR